MPEKISKKPTGGGQINRAEIVDRNFTAFVSGYRPEGRVAPGRDEPVLPGTGLTAGVFADLFESQLASRHLDLMARVMRLENKVFYTIGSSGHEGNALVGRLTRQTDPAFLHYRSGGFMAERSRKLEGIDYVRDSALSFAASSDDPASGGRHKVWGSKPLWVLPQTSTIASQLPKSVGAALALEQGARIGAELPVPRDSIVVCSFGDAGANHSTAQGAINAAQWAAHQRLPVPVLFVCEDNDWGISVRTPAGWIANRFGNQHGMHYVAADGLDLASGFDAVREAVEHCRGRRYPVFLHLRTTRLMGHAGTDFEVEYRDVAELERAEASDPLLQSARIAMDSGLMNPDEVLERYEAARRRCLDAAEAAHQRPKLETAEQVMAPQAPYSPDAVNAEATRDDYAESRLKAFGSEKALPENQPPRHLAVQINRALFDMMSKYDDALVFGEDVAQKGGVYTVTRNLMRSFRAGRVFNTLLDEQTILGLAQGYGSLGMLPIPELQYLAYFHNACDQIRGEACSLQFFSDDQFRNPMVVRIAGLGYQKGFGGHFHNDNSITALRDIPGLVVACPSRGDDAAMMLRTCTALARVDGRVVAFLEPIALYMTKDLHEEGDGSWQFDYPEPGRAVPLGEGRVYEPEARDLLIVTFGNGVPMALRAARVLEAETGHRTRVLDLRWLKPLNDSQIARHAAECGRVLVVDEGRRSGGVSEGIFTALVENLDRPVPMRRVVGEDSYTPLGPAAGTILPSDERVLAAARDLLEVS
jgi:2-oxoisovalerate dehydrogenase E1 component